MSRMSRKSQSIRPVAELFALSVVRPRCKHCEKPAAILDGSMPLCGTCFLKESLRRFQSDSEIN